MTAGGWTAAGFGFTCHRLGRSGWSRDQVLRSWAEAPWHRFRDGIAVACAGGEVLWLGITPPAESGAVTVSDAGGRVLRRLQCPPEWQLGWLPDARANPSPISPEASDPTSSDGLPAPHVLSLSATDGATRGRFALYVMTPATWVRVVGGEDLTAAPEPEPVARYSRIVKPPGA
ncbi:hypothetical protein [Roseateles noduli]|uniref:hypothetical protein n=1 Tax=Roseateles noduli TaxID=2052484 RepID=UPI003D64BDD5